MPLKLQTFIKKVKKLNVNTLIHTIYANFIVFTTANIMQLYSLFYVSTYLFVYLLCFYYFNSVTIVFAMQPGPNPTPDLFSSFANIFKKVHWYFFPAQKPLPAGAGPMLQKYEYIMNLILKSKKDSPTPDTVFRERIADYLTKNAIIDRYTKSSGSQTLAKKASDALVDGQLKLISVEDLMLKSPNGTIPVVGSREETPINELLPVYQRLKNTYFHLYQRETSPENEVGLVQMKSALTEQKSELSKYRASRNHLPNLTAEEYAILKANYHKANTLFLRHQDLYFTHLDYTSQSLEKLMRFFRNSFTMSGNTIKLDVTKWNFFVELLQVEESFIAEHENAFRRVQERQVEQFGKLQQDFAEFLRLRNVEKQSVYPKIMTKTSWKAYYPYQPRSTSTLSKVVLSINQSGLTIKDVVVISGLVLASVGGAIVYFLSK